MTQRLEAIEAPSITVYNEGLHMLDTNASHDLIIKPGSDLSADRIFTITTGDAARTLIMSGDLTVPATGTAALLNQANSFTLINPLITIAESWIGPSSTAGLYFKANRYGFGAIDPLGTVHIQSTASLTPGTNPAVVIGTDPTRVFALRTDTTTNNLILEKVSAAAWATVMTFKRSNAFVGVGPEPPTRQFHISHATLPYVHMTTDATGHTSTDGLSIGMDSPNNHAIIRLREALPIDFYTTNIVRVRLAAGGNFLIGADRTDTGELLRLYKVGGSQLGLYGGAADYATFAVAADGAMTITTVDADAALAHIILDPDGLVLSTEFIRATTAIYRRYYHLPLASFDPGASGATWTAATGNNLCGWQLNAAGETLEFQSDVHADWDAASDLILEIHFQILAASNLNDTVDIKMVEYHMGIGDSATNTQTVEVATNVGDGGGKAQFTMFEASFTIPHDTGGQEIAAGDVMCFIVNLETDSSEVDDILIADASIYYNTTHLGIESGDT